MSRWANRADVAPPMRWSPRQVASLSRQGMIVGGCAPGTNVGINWFQSRGSARDEIDVLNTQMHSFDNELTTKVRAMPGYPHSPSTDLEILLSQVWDPIMGAWLTWYKANRDTTFGYWNFDDVAKAYYAQLAAVRQRAAALGLSIDSPTPTPPQAPSLGGGLTDLENKLGGLAWTIAKIAIALAIAGIALPWAIGRVYHASEFGSEPELEEAHVENDS